MKEIPVKFLVRSITCRNNLIDAGRLLLAYRVPSPASQGAVIPLRLRSVNELAQGAVVAIELGGCDFEVFAAIVELPDEVHLAGIGVDLAAHFHGLLQGRSDDCHFLHLANWRDYRVQ